MYLWNGAGYQEAKMQQPWQFDKKKMVKSVMGRIFDVFTRIKEAIVSALKTMWNYIKENVRVEVVKMKANRRKNERKRINMKYGPVLRDERHKSMRLRHNL